ncbi:hypothetical protein K437DRAFT_258792 [Tilletiaria anomala UBC 951]|uniref:P-loop containing nucleoside triphosphate hydrolase protein n=1 Tax=Tilletiaria anomala (strain ATCC 24038 / CBS 436.72 / UBC 951) TaxID=1037660 RepID=A0A066VML8_TILAU|nr:uncharacterized protein K437DRAFT_258792 [Tilletiaria anomala UBC 951]KDN40009.1 hypothetical protein K437DRAFT_258792 [Tilletiaria anomala UBC 951]
MGCKSTSCVIGTTARTSFLLQTRAPLSIGHLAGRVQRARYVQTLCSNTTLACPRKATTGLRSYLQVNSPARRSPPSSTISRLLQVRWRASAAESQSARVTDSEVNARPTVRTTAVPKAQKATQGLRVRLAEVLKQVRQSITSTGGAEGEQPPFPEFRKLWGLASTQRKTLILALALLLVSSAVSLTVPAAVGRLIDYFSSSNVDAFWGLSFGKVTAILVTIFAIGAAAKAGSNIMLELAGIRLIQGMRRQSFASALKQDVEWAHKSAGDVVSRLSVDTSIVGESLTSDIGDGLRAAVTVLFAGSAMLWISTDLTLVMMGIVPPAAISAVFYGRYIRNLTHKTQDAVGRMTDVANERLAPAAFRTITAYNTQNMEIKRLGREIQSIAEIQAKEARATGFYYSGTGFVGNCAILTLLTYGGSLVGRGLLSVGDLTSLLMYTAYLGGGLASLTSFFASIMKGMGAGARVFSLIERDPKIKLGVGEDVVVTEPPAIEFRNVKFSYPSRPETKVLNDFNLKITPGSSVALVGASGVGKSSVHALALRLYDPEDGTVLLNGKDVKAYKPETLRDVFGVVGQEPVMFDGTIAENIAYSNPRATREQIVAAAEAAHCMDFIRTLPQELETNARQLSGGQRQRISIARSLCKSPHVLLMDEATSSLDSASEYLINQTISRIVGDGKITVWIIAHRLSTIKSASTVVVMDNGRIVESGTFDELNKPGTRFRELMAAQLGSSKKSVNVAMHSSISAGNQPQPSRAYSTRAGGDSLEIEQPWSVRELIEQAPKREAWSSEEYARLHKSAGLRVPSEAEAKPGASDSLLGLVESVRQEQKKE